MKKEFPRWKIGRRCIHAAPMVDLVKSGLMKWIDRREVVLLAVSGCWAMVRRPRKAPYIARVKELRGA